MVHDFGKALATGLCKLPGLDPIVSFPKWGKDLTPDQPQLAIAVVKGTKLNPFNLIQHARAINSADQEQLDVRPVLSIQQSAAPDHTRDLVCVQSLYCSEHETVLWVLDSGHAPVDKALPPKAAKLLRVDVNADGQGGSVTRIYTFPEEVAPAGSYLNDVRVDRSGFAYLTDSNSG